VTPVIEVSSNTQVSLSSVLKTHAVIEASAGTGKTWTIERLVEQILIDYDNVGLDRVLLVTFTEKAAGELRERIRKHIETRLSEVDEPVRRRLAAALDDFDIASIFTIHGFCNRVVKEFAFENHRPLELELGDDGQLSDRIVNRIIREDWPKAPPGLVGSVGTVASAVKRISGAIAAGHTYEPVFDGDISGCRNTADLIVWSARRHRVLIEEEFRRSSTLSFDRMVSYVRDAVMNPGPSGQSLCRILRDRYQFAMVDEFQDTDEAQWDIFRRVFVEGRGTNRLIVVGDPKQAIYGFRGADVLTYIKAVDTICDPDVGGRKYRLDTNYRSLPPLVDGFNTMFGGGEWFRQPASDIIKIDYDPSGTPSGSGVRPVELVADDSGRAPIVAMEFNTDSEFSEIAELRAVARASSGTRKKSPEVSEQVAAARGRMEEISLSSEDALHRWLSFVSNEILYLCRDSRILLSEKVDGVGRVTRRLNFGDICILYRKMPEDRHVMRALRRMGIPCSHYKQKGLYQGQEATHLLALFKALDGVGTVGGQARREAMLTRFFVTGGQNGETSADRTDAPGIVAGARAEQLLASWSRMCRERRWPAFFEAILHDTGLLAREAMQPDADRRITNWRQACYELAREASAGSLSLPALISSLERRRMGDAGDEDSDLHRIETDTPSVQVMTMHASKGLQYPVVFCFSGLTGSRNDTSLVTGCYRDKRRHHVINVDSRKLPEGCYVDDDTARLYYVAMTRARFKLYLPTRWIPRKKSDAPIHTIIDGAWNRLNASAEPGVVWSRIDFRQNLVSKRAPDLVPDSPTELRQDEELPPLPDLTPVAPLELASRLKWIDSYTSLSRRVGAARGAAVESAVDGRSLRDDDSDEEQAAPMVLLRGGKITGSAFHEVMEAISARTVVNGSVLDFGGLAALDTPDKVLDSPFGELIRGRMDAFGIPNTRVTINDVPDSAAHRFASLVMNATRTTLATDGELARRICDIPSCRTLPEVEFYMSESFGDRVPAWRRGLLNGLIDMVFELDGRYWFLDWKTTTPDLARGGVSVEAWQGDSLRVTMSRHGYDIQSRIYALAMLRWLRQRHGACAESMFGGGLFLFVRGMTAPGLGVWIDRFEGTGDAGMRIEDEVADLLSRGAAASRVARREVGLD